MSNKSTAHQRLSASSMAAAFLAAIFVSGCGGPRVADYASLGLVEVTGKVTLDGQPAPNLRVSFENPESKTFSFGVTDEAGAYRLKFNSEKTGCTPGKKIVRVSPGSTEEADESEDRPLGPKIPSRYNRKSELEAEVNASSTTFDFELKST